MITITETLYKKMPDDIKACFNQLPNPSSEAVRECFPDVKSGASGKGCSTKVGGMFGSGKDVTSPFMPASSGNASRFFKSIIYTAKASKAERNKGCEDMPLQNYLKENKMGGEGDTMLTGSGKPRDCRKHNNHPTVKPVALIRYLINMITPKGGVVLDPFAGSGTTGVACLLENRKYILIEKEKQYIEIIEARLKHFENNTNTNNVEQQYSCSIFDEQ